MARYLLIGGGGFLGANLAVHLAGEGHAVTIAAPSASSHREALGGAGVKLAYMPLADTPGLTALIDEAQFSAVIHLASSLIPASSSQDYLRERDAILLPTSRLALALAARNIPLVYVSSGGAVYGNSPADVLTEDMPCAPISSYGQAKVETEQAIHEAHRTAGLQYLIVRPSNPFGRFQRLDGRQGLISAIIGALKYDRSLPVWGDGRGLRDYIYIDDFCASMGTLLQRGVVNTTLNIGSGAGHSLLDVVHTVERVIGRSVPLEFHPARNVDVRNVVLGVGALRSIGAWQARTLEDGIRAYAEEMGLIHG